MKNLFDPGYDESSEYPENDNGIETGLPEAGQFLQTLYQLINTVPTHREKPAGHNLESSFRVGIGDNTVDVVVSQTGLEPSEPSGILSHIREYDASRVKTDPFTVYNEIAEGWRYNHSWLMEQNKPQVQRHPDMTHDYLQALPMDEKSILFASDLLESIPDMIRFTKSYGMTMEIVDRFCRLYIKDPLAAETTLHNSVDIMIEKGYTGLGEFMEKLME